MGDCLAVNTVHTTSLFVLIYISKGLLYSLVVYSRGVGDARK